jgi:GNAT superfamily N-acetyltransferase
MKIREVELTIPQKVELDLLDAKCFPGLEPYLKPGAYWWLAVDGLGAAAFAGLKYVGHNTGFLCRVGVDKAYRGLGLHKKLIRLREAKARKLGWKWIITYTSPLNVKSANNLISCGYKLYDPQTKYGVENALYFRKKL